MTLDVQYAPQLEVEGGTEAEEGADLVVRQQCNNIDGSAFQLAVHLKSVRTRSC